MNPYKTYKWLLIVAAYSLLCVGGPAIAGVPLSGIVVINIFILTIVGISVGLATVLEKLDDAANKYDKDEAARKIREGGSHARARSS